MADDRAGDGGTGAVLKASSSLSSLQLARPAGAVHLLCGCLHMCTVIKFASHVTGVLRGAGPERPRIRTFVVLLGLRTWEEGAVKS